MSAQLDLPMPSSVGLGPLDWIELAMATGFDVRIDLAEGAGASLVARWHMTVEPEAAPWRQSYVYVDVRRREWKGRVRYHVDCQSELAALDLLGEQFNAYVVHDTLEAAAAESVAFVDVATRLVIQSLFGFAVLTPNQRRMSACELAWESSDEQRQALAVEAVDDHGSTSWAPCQWNGRQYFSSRLGAAWRAFVQAWNRAHPWREYA